MISINTWSTFRDPGDLFNEAVAVMEKKKFDKQKEYVQEQTAAQVRPSCTWRDQDVASCPVVEEAAAILTSIPLFP